MKNRSGPDIIAMILEAANGGVTKTHLLMKANLTSGQLRKYIEILLNKQMIVELVDKEGKHTAYRTSEMGMRYLEMYSTLKNIAAFSPSAERKATA